MKSTDYSSAYTVYDNKLMADELDDYDDKIDDAEDDLNNYIDKWYSKFSQMETALAKLNSVQSSITSYLG